MRRFAIVLLAAALAAGCGPKHTRQRRVISAPNEFRPDIAASSHYNEHTESRQPEGELEQLLLDVVTQVAIQEGAAPPSADPRLGHVARDLAGQISGGDPPSYDLIEFALSHHGIIEPSPHLIIVEMEKGGEDALIEELRSRLPAVLQEGRYRRFGAGTQEDEGTVKVVLALQESYVDTDPVPRELPHKGRAELRARLRHPYKDPHVYVTPAKGRVTTLPLSLAADGGFRAQIVCAEDGRYQVEIGASNRLGAEVLANFPVYCGTRAPALFTPRGGGSTIVAEAGEAEAKIFELLNMDRVEDGLPPLALDSRVAAVARGHSDDMFANDFVGHVSPTTGTASDRLRRAKIASGTVLENVARAYSPEEAQAGLMNSPGHRANILNPDVTHVGIGVVLGRDVAGRPELFVTQVFIRIPPKLDPARAVSEVRTIIADRRQKAGSPRLTPDDSLSELAAQYARAIAAGESRDAARARLDAGLDKMGKKYSVVRTSLIVVGSLSQIATSKNLDDKDASHVGIGVAQGDDEQIGDAALFVVILMGKGR